MSSLLTAKELGEKLRLPSYQSAMHLLRTRSKEMKAFKLGREWRVDEKDVDAWLETLKAPTAGTRIEPKITPAQRLLKGKAY